MSERCLTKLFFLTFYSTLPITGTVPTYKDFRSKLSMNSLFYTTLLWPKIYIFVLFSKRVAKVHLFLNTNQILRKIFSKNQRSKNLKY